MARLAGLATYLPGLPTYARYLMLMLMLMHDSARAAG